jgi:hypothetical protein
MRAESRSTRATWAPATKSNNRNSGVGPLGPTEKVVLQSALAAEELILGAQIPKNSNTFHSRFLEHEKD